MRGGEDHKLFNLSTNFPFICPSSTLLSMTFDLIIQEFVKKLNVYQTNQYRLESHAVYTVQFIVYVVHKSLYVFGQGSCFYGQTIFVNI